MHFFRLTGGLAVLALLVTGTACLDEPATLPEPSVAPPPAPPVVVPAKAPEVAFARASKVVKSPLAKPSTKEDEAARKLLTWVVSTYGRDPGDPWAIGHAMLALGSDLELADGKSAVPWLFEEYAEWRVIGDTSLVAFPKRRGDVRIEPHSDLVLKALMETGVPLDAVYKVQGRDATVADLYRNSLFEAYVGPKGQTTYDTLEDAPWALQALATAAPTDLAWTAQGGKAMTMDQMTDVLAADLDVQTRFMAEAMAKGEKVEKRRQGLFAYTCGGQHTLQGVAYAVARGFGSPLARERVVKQVDILYWRMGIELEIYDTMIKDNPEYQLPLLEQRMKFLGHFLESAHKMAAMGLYTPTDAQAAQLDEARVQLIVTLSVLDSGGAFRSLTEMRGDPKSYQMYLDFVGDSAHALRGLDLATGEGTVTY